MHTNWQNFREFINQVVPLFYFTKFFSPGKSGYLSTYNQVLATRDFIEMWFIKVNLLGAPRLGKITARRRLTGEIKDIKSYLERQNNPAQELWSQHPVSSLETFQVPQL